MTIWVYTGEVSSKRLRERYLQAVLRQDIAFFDNVGPGEVATRIQTDTRELCHGRNLSTNFSFISADLVQQGTSEKVAMCCNFIAAFLTGFILAYARSWRLALAMSSILPCIAITGAVMNKFVSKYMQMSRQYISDSGSIAEEVISTIRTAHAFGTQKALADIYDAHINKSRKVDDSAAVWHGAGLAVFFFVIYAAYALSFSFGTTLINEGHG
jgi:ATP-binding cassette subfamily B (MDR/TAP) protein 1